MFRSSRSSAGAARWDDLPAAHAAAIFFDLLALALIFLLGRRVRGPTLGIALAYAGCPTRSRCSRSRATPTTRSWPRSCWRRCSLRELAAAPRGVFAALAGLTKFAPLALAPLLATHGLCSGRPGRGDREGLASTA